MQPAQNRTEQKPIEFKIQIKTYKSKYICAKLILSQEEEKNTHWHHRIRNYGETPHEWVIAYKIGWLVQHKGKLDGSLHHLIALNCTALNSNVFCTKLNTLWYSPSKNIFTIKSGDKSHLLKSFFLNQGALRTYNPLHG